MIIIFKFSSDTGKVSDGKSGFVIQIINYLGIDINNIFGEMTNFIVRKLGHFTEYFILCFLLMIALEENFSLKKAMKLSLFITFIYACSDEFHQLFVPERTGKIKDVLIDTCGGILAVGIRFLLAKKKI
ncbi:VanZ family protein [Clostridium tetanomorphum]|nr:VanZ family protein [Clostridium tetanomorphum]NRS83964.1 VanZ family protein [Clostridium tetanomorphum]